MNEQAVETTTEVVENSASFSRPAAVVAFVVTTAVIAGSVVAYRKLKARKNSDEIVEESTPAE